MRCASSFSRRWPQDSSRLPRAAFDSGGKAQQSSPASHVTARAPGPLHQAMVGSEPENFEGDVQVLAEANRAVVCIRCCGGQR